jgi:hypothetical protein
VETLFVTAFLQNEQLSSVAQPFFLFKVQWIPTERQQLLNVSVGKRKIWKFEFVQK